MGRLTCNHCGTEVKLPPANHRYGSLDITLPVCANCGKQLHVHDVTAVEDAPPHMLSHELFHYESGNIYEDEIAVGHDGERIDITIQNAVDYGERTIALPPDQARQMATAILAALDEQEGGA